MPDFRALLIEVRQVLLIQLLVNLEFLLRGVLFPRVNIGLCQTVVHVRQIWIEFARSQIFRNRLRILALVGVKIAQLKVCLRQARLKRNRLF